MTKYLTMLAYFAVILLASFGYIANIVEMFGGLSDPLTAIFIARAVGIFFAPLGVVLGYI